MNASGWTKIAVDDAGFLGFKPSDDPGSGDEGADPFARKMEGGGAAVRRRRGKANDRGEAREELPDAEDDREKVGGSSRSDP